MIELAMTISRLDKKPSAYKLNFGKNQNMNIS